MIKTFDWLMLVIVIIAVAGIDFQNMGLIDFGIALSSLVWLVTFAIRAVKHNG